MLGVMAEEEAQDGDGQTPEANDGREEKIRRPKKGHRPSRRTVVK